jgi:ribosomal protein S27E
MAGDDEFFQSDDDRTDEQRALDRAEAGFRLRRIQEERGFVAPPKPYTSRVSCPDCHTDEAVIQSRNGQATVRCAICDKHLYNAPRTETGERQRDSSTVRKGIKPSQQARVLDRDHGRCVLCGRAAGEDDGVIVRLGHLVSVEDGLALGLTDDEINDDANLAAMCEACDAGLNRRSVSAATLARLLAAAVRAEVTRRLEVPFQQLR